ncbi:hypothetical protein GW17_00055382, partial [Ensete ventricosum]
FCYFHCACDALAEVFQQWYQSQGFRAKDWFKITCDEIESRRIVLRILATFSQRRQRGGGAVNPHACRPPTARPRPRPPARGRPAATRASGNRSQGWRLRAEAPLVCTAVYGQLAGATVARGHNCLQRGARKGLPPAASPAASRRGGRPLARWLPAGKGSHRLHRGCGDAEGERGVRASFREKDDPAPMNSKNSKDCPRVHNFYNTLNNLENSKDCPLIQYYENALDNSKISSMS